MEDKGLLALLYGTLASAGMFIFYIAVLTISQGPEHAISQFRLYLPYMAFLLASFGVQIGLFSYAHMSRKTGIASEVMISGVSVGSMVACCAHHAVEILPLVGLSVFASFLSAFQREMIIVAIVSNLAGIFMVLESMRRSNLLGLGRIRFNMNYLTILAVLAGLAVIAHPHAMALSPAPAKGFEPKELYQNGLSIEALPVMNGDVLEIQLSLNTHTGNLDKDLTKISRIISGGREYYPEGWVGPPFSGHHLYGKLVFRGVELSGGLRLEISGLYGADWVFEWR